MNVYICKSGLGFTNSVWKSRSEQCTSKRGLFFLHVKCYPNA